ncbi:hypothetical protein WME98_10590 [Sorangium sp. So ce296]|uniref:hypothetical protein n=1 Tax=Sorangium TaxID=39643 RepID=UPI0004083A84|nr:hypothetical protein [Sorangium cellulosum]
MRKGMGPVQGRDTQPQHAEIIVEVGGSASAPWLRLGAERFHLGADLSDRFGFDGCVLEEDLLRIIVLLAMRRETQAEGWISADEIGVLLKDGASGAAISKQFERILRNTPCAHGGHELGSGFRLIEYWTRETGGTGPRGGRSRGPYRLGVRREQVRLDEDIASAALTWRPLSRLEPLEGDIDAILEKVRVAASAGRFRESSSWLDALLLSIYRGNNELVAQSPRKERSMLLARIWDATSIIDMEMGRPADGLRAARRARALYAISHHPEGIAHTWQVEAHLLGQSDDPENAHRALAAARMSLVHLDSASRSNRRGIKRAQYVGTLGQRLTVVGATQKAEKSLEHAYRTSTEHGFIQPAATWALRLAENALKAKNLRGAENLLMMSHERQQQMSVPQRAAFARIFAAFHGASGHREAAQHWLAEALEIGERHQMLNQIRLVTQLERSLRRVR